MSVNPLNSPRLNELIHQRELLRSHLAWLDGEIARESGIKIPPPTPGVDPAAAASVSSEPTIAPRSFEGYAPPDPKTTAADTKKGCLVVALLVVFVFLATLVGIYFWKYSDRPLLFATPEPNAKPGHR